MALVSLAQARAQVRVETDYPEDQLAPYIDGAVDAAQAYLNRVVYESSEALAAARDAYAAAVSEAGDARSAANDSAAEIADEDEQAAALRIAELQYQEAMKAAEGCIHGVVVNGSIRAAILLTLGNLFANRESVVTGVTVAELPLGVIPLLRPYRRVMMP